MKFWNIIFILFFSGITLSTSAAGVVYPIQTMSKVECRFQDFASLGSECKMQLPILKTADYTKYKNDYSLYRRVYTVLWGSTYNYGRDVGNGGHQGVDIATAKGTPVYAITDGKVVLASELAGRGKTVKIEHTINGRKVYSNSSHLSVIGVNVGDQVKANTKIGEVGNTGNSYGNHLHFQIDVAVSGKGPWYRSSCSEKNYDKIVNSPVCYDQLNTNTIDPLLFLETSGAIVKQNTIEKKPVQKISKEGLLSREEIQKREIEEFLKYYQIKVSVLGFGGNIELGKTSKVRVSVIDKRTKKPFTGSFPGNMNFKFDGNRFTLFPEGILQIDKGVRDFSVTPKMVGKMNFEVYLGESFLQKVSFGVINTKQELYAASSALSMKQKVVIGDTNKGILYFKENYGLNLVGVKFAGSYTLTSSDKNIIFCIKKAPSLAQLQYTYNIKCDEKSFAQEKTFSYADTMSGVLLFEYKVFKRGASTFLVNSTSKNITSKVIAGTDLKGLEVTYPYYNEIVTLVEKGIANGINKGYFLQDRELSKEDGYMMIQKVLEKRLSECGGNSCKNKILEKLYALSKENFDRYTFFTRGEYLGALHQYLEPSVYTKSDFYDFRDLSDAQKIFAKNIFGSQTWKDYFGQTKYFQPNKNLTRGESTYMLIGLLDK